MARPKRLSETSPTAVIPRPKAEESLSATDAARREPPGRGRLLWASLLLVLAIWLPRGLALDRFVTADEHAWLARSGNFLYALAHGDWAGTFQRHHPGVTVTWAGLVGYLVTYPGYAGDAPGQFGWLTEEVEPFLRSQGHDPVAVLAAGRMVAAIWITLALVACFWLARRLLGFWPAFFGVGLIALAPFPVAHARLLHLDGQVSAYMLLAVLAWLLHLQTRSRATLLLAGVTAGLAWLTRSPALFLGPLIALITVGWLLARRAGPREWGAWLLRGVVWVGIGGALFVLLWPAMWVDPVGSLRQVLTAAGDYAAEGHLKPTFFDGEIYAGDPGFWFYPLTWAWRTTPLTWIGLAFALIGLALRRTPLTARGARGVVIGLLVYGLGFMLLMNLGAKKFDRYILPSHLALELVAGAGWAVALHLAAARGESKGTLRFMPLAAGSVLLGQALFLLPTYPYYLTFYNPALGGSAAAPQTMMIGWGEGADEAGCYLDAKPDAAELRVASGYTNGPLSYFFRGTTLPLTFWHQADYAAVFVQDRQRQLPSRRSAAYFHSLTPEHVVTLNGIDYAWLYDLRGAPLPAYVTDWGGAIRLVTFQLPAAQIRPGETVRAVFYLVSQGPIATNLNVLVRVVGTDGTEIARDEGWPWGAATSGWQAGVVWPDGHDLTIPPTTPPGYYRVELGFYDPATQELLPAVQPATGAALPDLVTVDTLQVGDLPPLPRAALTPPVTLGDAAALLAAAGLPAAGTLAAGDALTLRLHWRGQDWIANDYTAFVHLVGPDGGLVAQVDRQPILPTSAWAPGQRVVDSFTLTLPPGAVPGDYTVYTGFYDLATGARLPVAQGATSLGDAFVVGAITVK